MKKIPERTCVVSHEKLPKNELIRIVNNKEQGVIVDLTGKVNGHGVYIKKDMKVLNKAKKSNILEKSLETKIDSKVYEELEKVINS